MDRQATVGENRRFRTARRILRGTLAEARVVRGGQRTRTPPDSHPAAPRVGRYFSTERALTGMI
jgi:hypothetical protein